MLGAILAKREIRKGFEALNRHDLETVVGMFQDDGAFVFPTQTIMGGRYEGTEALSVWFARWFERMPEIHFTLTHVSVEDIFAFGATNVVHAEWELDETDTDGNSYHLSGVTSFDVKGGSARLVKDYIFDQDVLAEAWPAAE